MENPFQENAGGGTSFGNVGTMPQPSKYLDRKQKLQEAKTISEYLKFLNKDSEQAEADMAGPAKPKARKVSPETVEKQIMRLDQKMASADLLSKLDMVQKRIELEKKLKEAQKQSQMPDHDSGMSEKDRLENAFVEIASAYSERKGISYEAWRKLNVPAAVLRKAGLTRGTRFEA